MDFFVGFACAWGCFFGDAKKEESGVSNMRKSIAVFCVLSLLMLALVACGGGASRPEQLIAGRWEPDGPAQFQSMEFIPHGGEPQRGRVNLRMLGNEISGEYQVTPGEEQHHLAITYTLTMFPTTREFFFTIEDDALELQEENAGERELSKNCCRIGGQCAADLRL
jgi:hypothetical protein